MFCRSEKKEVKVLPIFLLICTLHTNASTACVYVCVCGGGGGAKN
jgi:hypothetical protein